ncbi:hypothetical protein B9G98_02805 [Wickerhamiella sorbophila]|uniref:Arrestin-like N-terminal domain-containing protein n=1 Tax=Wickerhamiella sorbophila TaxID=45607 RepID=A0A2T0FJP3_9ASCO|nr:hypothetical protein B9G98_02805 [Wickerhamiella sorbophila]PRT55185.1 hypothetical protein B9G98_02805 [Wickerhamiella sorbophila]
MITISIELAPPQGEEPPPINGLMANRLAFTNGDIVRGKATVVTKSHIEVSSLIARCECRTFAKAIQTSAAAWEEKAVMWSSSNYILPSPEPCGYDLPEISPNVYAMAPGTYVFPFQFRLPNSSQQFPESLEESGCVSGVFWEVQFLVKRNERLTKNAHKTVPFRFIPMCTLPLSGDVRQYRKELEFLGQDPTFKPSLLGRFFTKHRIPVRTEAVLTIPRMGLVQAPLFLELGLQLVTDIQNMVVVEDIIIQLHEITRVFVPTSDSAYERGTTRHSIAKLSPHRLLDEKVVDFTHFMSDLQIRKGLIGSVDEVNFEHCFELKLQLILRSAYCPSNTQKLAFKIPVKVIPQQLEHLPDYIPTPPMMETVTA